MKKIIYILSTILILQFLSCENVDVTGTVPAYKEYTVVRAELAADSVFQGVTFTKTLPTDVPYDIKKAELTNVEAYLKVNGTQVIPLNYTSNGIYNSIYKTVIKAGNTYELFAEYNGKSIYAVTYVPLKPVIESAGYTNENYINAYVGNKIGVAYGCIWEVMYSPSSTTAITAPDFLSVINSGTDTLSNTVVRTMTVPSNYINAYYYNQLYVKVYAFDKAYTEYFATKNNNQPVSNIFAQGGDKVAWNVKGADVIGLFMGMNESSSYLVSQ